MPDPNDYGFVVDAGYDETKWIPLPDGSVDVHRWANDCARAWSDDLRRDDRFRACLADMLELLAGKETDDNAVFVRVLAPAGEMPDLQSAKLFTLPTEQSLDENAQAIAASYREDAVEPPTIDTTQLTNDEDARVLTVHAREEDGSIRSVLHVCWLPHPELLATLMMADYDIGGVLTARNDVIELARAIRFRFGTAAELGRER